MLKSTINYFPLFIELLGIFSIEKKQGCSKVRASLGFYVGKCDSCNKTCI